MRYTLLWSCGRNFLKTKIFKECHKHRAIPPDESSTKDKALTHVPIHIYVHERLYYLIAVLSYDYYMIPIQRNTSLRLATIIRSMSKASPT